MSDFNKAIVLEPEEADGYRYRGDLLSDVGRHEAALDDYEKALRLTSNSAVVLSARGVTLKRMGRTREALADFTRSISAAKGELDESINEIDEKGYLSEEEKERRRQNAIAERNRRISLALTQRGNTFRDRKEYEQALNEYAKALAVRPEEGFTYTNRGLLHSSRERLLRPEPTMRWRPRSRSQTIGSSALERTAR
jgi:tetratricopeptide (TPR) repeat protein